MEVWVPWAFWEHRLPRRIAAGERFRVWGLAQGLRPGQLLQEPFTKDGAGDGGIERCVCVCVSVGLSMCIDNDRAPV